MAGTTEGGKAAAETNKAKYGADFYSKLGIEGAKKYRERQERGVAKPRGFAAMSPEKHRQASLKGGRSYRPGKAVR